MFIQSKRAFAGLAAALAIGCALSEVDDDDDVVIGACGVEADDSDCEVCIKTGCCDAYTQCQSNPDCVCVLDCADEGQPRDVCATRCNVTDAEISDMLTLLSGDNQTCSVECQDECDLYDFADYDDDDI